MRARSLAAAGPVLLAALTVVAALTPGHSQRRDTISALAAPGQPLRTAAVAALVLYGVLVLAGARSGLVRLHGGATIVVALVPKTGAFTASVPNVVHVGAAIAAGAALVAAMVVRGDVRWAAVAVLAAVAFRAAWGTDVYGALERVVVAVGVAWVSFRSC